ncbi:hypothetical protein G5I_05883 [Acromyrmex echinatior]|uniref:Ig-like domain-containing protein n=1 Tax=Acromyrmex echinatior TaxID=103372 RepID=F4WJK4_ACREC|nr:hypothetical protein G5I_05883 [Acromyrmex echinatior]
MVRSGESVTLSCHYDLEGLALYTIQWFFNDREFYRFIPDRKPPPPYSIFDVDGIQVNVSKSNSHDVTLVNVSRELTGIYKCEVSAGSPSYHTGIERAKMEVVGKQNFTLPFANFEVLAIDMCVSRAHPKVSKSNSHDVTLVNVSRELTGIYKCEVSAGSPSYHTGIERAKMEVVAVPRDTLETLALVVSTKHDRVVVQVFPVCSVTPPAPLACRQVSNAPKTDPAIRTEKDRIAVGEMLRVNCTSGKSRPAPDVTWKINGEAILKNSGLYKIRHFQTSHDNVTQSITSLIEFRVINSMFRKGYLHLRCTVYISDVYRKSVETEISEDMPRIASITGESPPFGHQKSVVAGKFNPYWSTLSSPIYYTNRRSTRQNRIENHRPEYTPREEKSISGARVDESRRGRFVYERPDGSFGKSSGSR